MMCMVINPNYVSAWGLADRTVLDMLRFSHEELKREVENMRELLMRPRDEKIELVKAVARVVGVELPEDLFK